MHDPMTVAFEIKSPFKKKSICFPEGYRETLVTIWHVDPEKDGSDDSCGWFKRARHGDEKVLERIINRFESDWDRTWTYDPSEDCESEDKTKKIYPCGFFNPNGMPRFSVQGIVLNLFFLAALEVFKTRDKAVSFCRKNLFDIMLFAENPVDSLHDTITLKFGNDTRREDRIQNLAATIYGWILRASQPWYRHARWHFWHWKIDIRGVTRFKRWAFSKCCLCGKGFKWGYSPVTNSRNETGPRWFRSEKHVFHADCQRPESDCCADAN